MIRAASFLDGQLLIAMPGMEDERFARSVVYICAHSSDGAMGIIVNKPVDDISFPDLLEQLEIVSGDDEIRLPPKAKTMRVHRGGPVETGRGFVLHSDDYRTENATLPIDDGVCLTATIDILRAIVENRGPARALLALGYAGWAPGQLEGEILANGWLTCAADPDLVFDGDLETKYDRALLKLGIAPGMLSRESGHA
ncbi:YqgE/AlgH family protein [Segnochrobactrum spirostomi]|uniref:UPF0301 protein F0357_14935 n=1 Tax=Segnochrobactrum spirostomi TaxID=2608987 RepID=A0A6A7Y8U6_9HYPH|nr:YqgE/AlgH family protein [Segnochrobactrum spirostomi]MQT13909.1 YqgE/AlgH family protein [Segnochrobactrum spirostomi]